MELSKEDEEEEDESSGFESRQLSGCFSLRGDDSDWLWVVMLPDQSEIMLLIKLLHDGDFWSFPQNFNFCNI